MYLRTNKGITLLLTIIIIASVLIVSGGAAYIINTNIFNSDKQKIDIIGTIDKNNNIVNTELKDIMYFIPKETIENRYGWF